MKKLTKVLVLLLTVALLCTGLVFAINADTSVASVNSTDYDTLKDAIAAAEDGATVKLTADATVADTVKIAKNVTIDLSGHTLNSTGSLAFEVTESVKFEIVGAGNINVKGMLYKTASGKSPEVNLAGKGEGITLTQDKAKGDPYITYTYDGTFLYKNLEVTTNYSEADGNSVYVSFFHSDTTADNAQITLNGVEFHAPVAVPNDPGTFILGACGTQSKLIIKNSALYTTASGLYLGHLVAPDNITADGVGIETTIAEIESSIISAVSSAKNSKIYGICLEKEGFANTGAVGIVSIKDSLVESSCRTIYASIANDKEQIQLRSTLVKLANSTLKLAGAVSGANTSRVHTRHTEVQLDATSKVSSYLSNKVIFATQYGTVVGQVGTRTNAVGDTTGSTGICFPDGKYGTTSDTYTWVYDPVGNADYPYVIKLKADTNENSKLFKYENLSFEGIYAYRADRILYQAGKKTFSDNESFSSKLQFSPSAGTVYYATTKDNSYLRYVITANSNGNKHTVTGNTMVPGIDPFFVFGGSSAYDKNYAYLKDVNTTINVKTSDTVITPTTLQMSRAKVVVASIDFGTDSFDAGYPAMTVYTQARYTQQNSGTIKIDDVDTSYDATGKPSTATVFNIKSDGKLEKCGGLTADNTTNLVLNSAGKWNRLTAVFYTDPSLNNGKGIAYYYLNGKPIGTTTAVPAGGDLGYIQGIRFAIATDAVLNLDSSIVFDNSSFRVYNDFVYETAVDGVCDGTYYPEKYINTTLENEYIDSTITVSGVPYSLAVANTKAKELDSVVDFKEGHLSSYVLNKGVYESVETDNTATYNAYYALNSGDKLVLLKDLNLKGTKTFTFNYVGTTEVNGVAVDADYTAEEIAKMREKAVKIEVDLNGNSILSHESGRVIAKIKNNVDISFYSSKPGATIEGYYYNTTESKIRAQRLFAVSGGDEDTVANSKLAYNAHLSVGKFVKSDGTVIPGSNIMMTGSVLLEGITGDDSTSLTMDGVVGIRSVGESKAAIITRAFDGTITIKNSLIINPLTSEGNHIFEMFSYYVNGNRPTTSEVIDNGDGTTTTKNTNSNNEKDGRKEGYEDYIFTPLVYVENSTLINLGAYMNGSSGAGNIVSNNGDGMGVCLVFNNVTTNGRLNPSNIGQYRVRVFGGVSGGIFACDSESYYIDAADAALCETLGVELPSGPINTVKMNTPMTIPTEFLTTDDYIEIQIPTGKDADGNFTYETYCYANGDYTGEGFAPSIKDAENDNRVSNRKVILPYLTQGSALPENTVNVNWTNVDGTVAKNEKYAKGGIYAAITAPAQTAGTKDGVALTFSNDGTWKNAPKAGDVLTDDVTVTPGLKVEGVKITGLETNLSIYSDFGVNLYIPAEYAEYVEVKYGETALEETAVVIDEKNYVRVTVRRNVKDITEGVKFDITVTEEGASVAKSATVNIVTYAKDILAGDSYTEADKYLMYYMLAYAKEAVKYLNSAEAYDETLAAATETYKAYATKDVAEYQYVITNTGLGSVLDGASVQLTSSPNFIFTFKDLDPTEGVSYFKGTVEVKYGENVQTLTADGTESYVVVSDMKAYNFASLLEITIKDENGEVVAEGNYNLDTFANYHVTNAEASEESAKCVDLVKAFYNYVAVANAYKAGTLVETEPAA